MAKNDVQVKVFVTREIPEAGIDLLRRHGFGVAVWPEDRPIPAEELVRRAASADVLLTITTDRIDTGILQALPQLRLISQFGAGFNNIDIAAADRMGIPVCNTPGAMSQATADIAFGLMLAVSRKFFFMHKNIIRGRWTHFRPKANLGFELRGKALGIFGLGRIGMEVAKRCKGAYDMEILYCNRTRNEEAERRLNARRVSFEELLKNSDIVSAHCALTNETKGIFNKDAFSKMKPSAIFINTARGGVHHEADLIDALQRGVIWGAGLDVTDPEPMAADNPLLAMENVAVLPHIGSATIEARTEMSRLAADNIIQFYSTGVIPNPVNSVARELYTK
jgi:glyoxylate reductase